MVVTVGSFLLKTETLKGSIGAGCCEAKVTAMLDAIISWSLRHRVAVLALWAGVAAMGVAALLKLPVDAFPDTTPVQVQVNTVAPALSPLEIERQVTAPVEQAIGGLPGLLEVGLSPSSACRK
jgi:Cu/Ag efflux pump CusA